MRGIHWGILLLGCTPKIVEANHSVIHTDSSVDYLHPWRRVQAHSSINHTDSSVETIISLH